MNQPTSAYAGSNKYTHRRSQLSAVFAMPATSIVLSFNSIDLPPSGDYQPATCEFVQGGTIQSFS